MWNVSAVDTGVDTVAAPAPVHAWQAMYPPLQCHAQGWLDVGNGHRVYWEECGNPLGRPALFVHGGPGAGCTTQDRRWFNPQHTRIVLFDQRGCGRSRPLGATDDNTTAHLLRDMEMLREHLHIARWLLFGGSWGATLALVYAQRHADRVQALVLRGVFLGSAAEREWLYGAHGVGEMHRAAWRRFSQAVPRAPSTALLDGFAAQLHSGNAAAEHAAAHAWMQWEQDLMALEMDGDEGTVDVAAVSEEALAAARIGVHYARHAYFLREGQLLQGAPSLRDISAIVVQGQCDLITAPHIARALQAAWPAAQWHFIANAGHSSTHPAMAQRLVAATDHFARMTTGDMP